MDFHALLKTPIDMTALGKALDAMSVRERLAAIRSMNRDEQSALYDAAKGFLAITVEDIVPSDVGTMAEVIHEGKNTLAMFTKFQKRFCRLNESNLKPNELAGYNHQLFRWFTGPGYFVAYDLPGGEVLVDYKRLPSLGLPTWPKVLSNSARLSRWVYYNTQDTLRGVSRHVTIGRAAKNGADMPNWFVLCRMDPERAALPAGGTT